MTLPGCLTWRKFYTGSVKGLKVFAFYLAVLSVFRVIFIFALSDYWGAGTGLGDVWTALSRGTRLSMQSAGCLTLVSFLPGLVMHYVSEKWEQRVYAALNGVLLVVLSVLFVASFPYYRQFHANFNQMLFTGAHDDLEALFWTMVQQYALPVRLLGALVLAYVLWRSLRWLLTRPWPVHARIWFDGRPSLVVQWAGRVLYLCGCYLVVLLGIFGGSLGWQTAVDWENAGVTRDEFLNEAILDNPQAIYRAYQLNARMLACNGLDFSVEDIRSLAALHAGRAADSDDLTVYLQRTAQGPATAQPPRHVFLVISESLANWPLLEKYQDIPIATGLRALIAQPDTDYCPTFLPNGASTVSAVTGVVTGLADANLYLTTMPESFAAPYPTASAPQLAALGYTTNFWYAGPATWERIGAFTQAQGFQHFYSRGDFGDVPGSVWGCEDEYLYARVLAGLDDTPSFHVILNASNHSPYDVDVAVKGFDVAAVQAALPEALREDEELLRELGHYWYADRELAHFVQAIKTQYPDSLIVIVGDHADRYHLDKQPVTYERYGVPFIVTGAGVHKGTLAADAAGSQIDIVPTILELIAPRGYEYQALGTSLTRGNKCGVNYGFWLTRQAIGKADTVPLVSESLTGGAGPAIDQQAMQDYINAIRSISWYLPKYGPILDAAKLQDR